jgi:hypothetical protein
MPRRRLCAAVEQAADRLVRATRRWPKVVREQLLALALPPDPPG